MRPWIALVVTVVLGLTTACSGDGADTTGPRVDFTDAVGEPIVVDPDISAAAAESSRAAFAAADVVLLATPESADAFAQASREARLPLLVTDRDDDVAAEVDRLGATTVVVATGSEPTQLTQGREVIEVDPSATLEEMDLPSIDIDEDPTKVTLVLDPSADPAPSTHVVKANVTAAGGQVIEIAGGDPRASAATVAAIESAGRSTLVAVGESFGSSADFASRVHTATSVPQLPGGGQTLFPGRRMVALYGSPGVPALGPLGEQGIEASIDRAKDLAKDYEEHSEVPVVPAFEIIATVASADPGPDGDYSNEIDPQTLRPWVEAAGEAGVYVVLDLQPGRTDFLTQAGRYEDLLTQPHVGLALDPEWRLQPHQRHMEQIGSVGIDEVNEVADWLARLTRENSLPQKTFLLHQFSLSMIRERERLDTSHDELATIVHADGHGTPDLKMGTWEALQKNLPVDVWMGWKNFYDEDTPTFSPERTYGVDPKPWFVSYQ